MEENYKKDVLFVIGVFLFISLAIGSSEEEADETVLPFDIPATE